MDFTASLEQDYQWLLANMSLLDSEKFRPLIDWYMSFKNWDQEHTEGVLDFVSTWQRMTHYLACKSQLFASLPREDQTLLLVNNGELFAMYLFSQFLVAESRQEQVAWICGQSINVSKRLPYPWINADFGLVNKFQHIIPHHKSYEINHFKASLEKSKALKMDRSKNALVAHYLIFNLHQFENPEQLIERDKIASISKHAEELTHFKFSMADFVLNLKRMASTCGHILQPSTSPNIDVLWHEMDRALIENKVQLYHSVWHQFAPPSDYYERMIKLRQGEIQLRPGLHVEGQYLLFQRLRQIISVHLGPDQLRTFDFQEALRQTQPTIALLQLVKVTTAPSFLDQVRLICGQQVGLEKLVCTMKTDVRDLLVAFKVIDNEAKFNAFGALVKKLGRFVKDDDLYILTLLFLTFTKIEEASQGNNIQNELSQLILRKLNRMYPSRNALDRLNGFQADLQGFEALFANYMTF